MTETVPVHINDEWILAKRTAKNRVDPFRPYAWLTEQERSPHGELENVATIFLTNRECPYHCLFCDLWKNTTDVQVPHGAIPEQIGWALQRLPKASVIKLYNSGNFFDRRAITSTDIPKVAQQIRAFRQVVVECHPKLIDHRAAEFKNLLQASLQVAMGLETVHPEVLPRLNKRMTLGDFETASGFLNQNGISLRVFILLRPPFLTEQEGIYWAKKSLHFAFDVGAECCVIIPTRLGNGALHWLHKQDLCGWPEIKSLEEVLDYGLQMAQGRVLADLWDLEKFSTCPECGPVRKTRLQQMNLSQSIPPPIECDACHAP